jgi:signal transduction histidine kinase
LTIEGRKVFSAFLRDIRERKQAERALKEAYEQLRDLTGRLTEAEEVERRRLARELHDEFGQALTGLKFDVAWLTKEMSRVNKVPDAAGIKAKTMGMSHAIDGLIKSVRATAASLRPGVLDDLGLVAALEWLAGSFHERTGCAHGFSIGHHRVSRSPRVTDERDAACPSIEGLNSVDGGRRADGVDHWG